MPEYDMFAWLIKELGPPKDAVPVSAAEADRYRDRLPEAMRRFWTSYGRGSYKNGGFWICDPAPFDQPLADLFAGDPEFDASQMTVIEYTSYGTLQVWDKII